MLISKEALIIIILCIFSVNFLLLICWAYRLLKSKGSCFSCVLDTSRSASIQDMSSRSPRLEARNPLRENTTTCNAAIVILPTENGHCSPQSVTVQQTLGEFTEIVIDPPSYESAVHQDR